MYTLKQVTTKKQLKQFIEFPNELYKDNEYYVPSLYQDEYTHLNPKKNPISSYCDTILYLAYDENNKIVGRVCGIINHNFNKDKNVKQARFTRLDMIDDINVTKLLIDAIEKWAKENDMNEVIGPIGFTDLDKQGLLVKGYDQKDTFITLYHYPYYKEHLEKLGYHKDVDWKENLLDLSKLDDTFVKKVNKIAKFAADRYGYHLIKVRNRFRYIKLAKKMFEMYNEAFSKIYGFQELTEEVQKFYVKQVFFIINKRYCWFVADKDENIVGFGVLVPSMSEVTRKYKGKLNLFNFTKYLKAINKSKSDRVDLYFIAVKPEFQHKGVPSLIFADALIKLKEDGFRYAETGPELEYNYKALSLWDKYHATNHRTRRCYHKYIDGRVVDYDSITHSVDYDQE